jgi:MFS family permease
MPRLLPNVKALPRSLWFLCLGAFVNRLGGFVAPFLAIYLTRVRLLSVERAGIVISLLGFGAFLSGPLGGYLADRFGRRPALAIATSLGGSAMLALGFARSIPQITCATFALGMCGDLYRPTVGALVADILPAEDRARGYGLLYWAINVGFSASLIIAGFLAGKSFTLLFIGDALTTFLFGVIVYASVPETRPAETLAKKSHKTAFFEPYRDLRFVAFCFLSMCVATIFFQGQMTMPLDMRAHDVSNAEFGALLSINGIVIVIFQPFVSGLINRFDRGRVLAFGALLTGLGFATCGIARGSLAIYAASVLIWTIGEISMAPLAPSVIADMAPSSRRGAYQGAYQLSWGGAAFLAPVIGSYVLASFGARALWASCAVAGALCALGYLSVVRKNQVDPRSPSIARAT